MRLLAIDHDPWTKLGPSIAHDLELSRDGLQLSRGRVTYFYFELFHLSIFILPFNCVFFVALGAWSLELEAYFF